MVPSMRERDWLSWVWVAIVGGSAILYSIVMIISVSGADDPIDGMRAAAVGVFAGIGVVTLITEGLDYLYRHKPRVWIAISPRPWMVIALGIAVLVVVVASLEEPLRIGYLLGGMLWMQAVYSRFLRQEENDLRQILSDPDRGPGP